ncbi:unnamed protein product [Parnassius mnemosyne]|uniref:Phospholipase A2 n=1 Tax=Parnassius mnemosyne TaxID=213953 RepID=A0AAV1K7K5_9NEOP
MEWTKFYVTVFYFKKWHVHRKWKKLSSSVYAGLIVLFMPFVLSDDWSSYLTYEEIYNNTNYAQIRETGAPYNKLPKYNFNSNYKSSQTHHNVEEAKDSDVGEYNFREQNGPLAKEQLLVGFSHSPYRYSVPEADYLKGVRDIDPNRYTNKNENRGKRGVLHLYNMILCATGCEPLAYKGYGCYCGFLGSGRPTDGIDNCCRLHDECYENIYCPFFTVYFQPYYWKCYRNRPLCALENYQTRNQFINGCAARLCECDRKFAMCVKKYSCPRGRALCHSSPLRLLQNILMFR